MDYQKWAKQHKTELVKKLVGSIKPVSGDEKPLAIFLAGIPGAGKTELIERLIEKDTTLVRIDLDEVVKLFPEYSPENYYEYRSAASLIVDETVIYCRQHRINFILDGTFGHPKAVANIESALKRHEVAILYIWKQPPLAWKHTQDRQLLTKRGIDRSGFITACEQVPKNVREVQKKFGSKISIVAFRKNLEKDTFEIYQDSKQIDDLLSKSYNEDEIKDLAE